MKKVIPSKEALTEIAPWFVIVIPGLVAFLITRNTMVSIVSSGIASLTLIICTVVAHVVEETKGQKRRNLWAVEDVLKEKVNTIFWRESYNTEAVFAIFGVLRFRKKVFNIYYNEAEDPQKPRKTFTEEDRNWASFKKEAQKCGLRFTEL